VSNHVFTDEMTAELLHHFPGLDLIVIEPSERCGP
jgi:hypothetical protein